MFNKCFVDTQMIIMIIEQLIVGDFQLMFVDNYVPSVGCGRPSGTECSILSTCTLDVKNFMQNIIVLTIEDR